MSAPAAPERHPGDRPAPFRLHVPRAGVRVVVCLVLGLMVAAAVVGLSGGRLAVIAPLGGWDAAAVAYLGWVWLPIRGADSSTTAALAVREDGSVAGSDVLLLVAAVASLVGVGAVIATGSGEAGAVGRGPAIALSVASVLVSWAVVHTLYALRYARLYYVGPDGGIDFNQDEPPCYADFAYLAFTLGMTYQVSDTALSSSVIRRTALRHALLSYVFGSMIIAITINLVAGLAK